LGAVKKKERTEDGEDREEESQGEGSATSQGEADPQQARWQRSPPGSRAHTPSQGSDAPQGGLKKQGKWLMRFRPDRGSRSGRRFF